MLFQVRAKKSVHLILFLVFVWLLYCKGSKSSEPWWGLWVFYIMCALFLTLFSFYGIFLCLLAQILEHRSMSHCATTMAISGMLYFYVRIPYMYISYLSICSTPHSQFWPWQLTLIHILAANVRMNLINTNWDTVQFCLWFFSSVIIISI